MEQKLRQYEIPGEGGPLWARALHDNTAGLVNRTYPHDLRSSGHRSKLYDGDFYVGRERHRSGPMGHYHNMTIGGSRQQVPKRVRKSNATYKEPPALDLPRHEKRRDSQDARNFYARIASCKAERRKLKLDKKPKKSRQ